MANRADAGARRRERFAVMAVRLAHLKGWSKAQTFDELPPDVRQRLAAMDYADVVAPLMAEDRRNGLSLRQLSFKYVIPKTTVSRRLTE